MDGTAKRRHAADRDGRRDELIERLFAQVLEHPPEQRDAFLDEACPDLDLRREIVALLPHAEGNSGFLRTPVLHRPGAELFEPLEKSQDRASQATAAPREVGIPEEIGGYRILRVLGYGGTAVVYAAQSHNGPRVALKLFCPGPITPGLEHRFHTEARLLRRLRHPGIVRIFDAGWHRFLDPWGGSSRLPFLVLELARGDPLDTWVHQAVPSLAEKLRLFASICDVVEYIHRRGVIHRDLKPANIVVGEWGRLKILDFGIARALGSNNAGPDAPRGAASASDRILGSPPYMCLEQLRDPDSVDRRADVYSLGVILYQVLAGRPPYEIDDLSLVDSLLQMAATDPRPLATYDPTYGGQLSRIVSKAMAKDRARRYESVPELAAEVRRYLRTTPG